MSYLLSSHHMLSCRERAVQEILHEREKKKASKKLKVDLQSLQKRRFTPVTKILKFFCKLSLYGNDLEVCIRLKKLILEKKLFGDIKG